MPILLIRCPKCYTSIPIAEAVTHFSDCGAYGAPLVDAVLSRITSDKRHTTLAVTTTSGNDCPRRGVIQRCVGYEVTLDEILPPELGTILHDACAAATLPDDWVTERCTCRAPYPLTQAVGDAMPPTGWHTLIDGEYHLTKCGTVRCTLSGALTLDGETIPISGRVDAIHFHPDDTVTLYDWKFQSSHSARWIGEPEPHHLIQAIVNAELMRQTGHPVRAVHYGIVPWYTYRAMVIEPVPPVSELKRLHPRGASFSAWEIYRMTADAYARINAGESASAVIDSLPLVGESMARDTKNGSMCTKFCGGPRSICTTMAIFG